MKHAKPKTKKKTPVKDRILIIIFSIIIVLSLLSVAGVFVMNTSFLASTGDTGESKTEINSGVLTPSAIKGKSATFLVCGIDYAEGTGRGKLTDVVMLVNFDIAGENIDILQMKIMPDELKNTLPSIEEIENKLNEE